MIPQIPNSRKGNLAKSRPEKAFGVKKACKIFHKVASAIANIV